MPYVGKDSHGRIHSISNSMDDKTNIFVEDEAILDALLNFQSPKIDALKSDLAMARVIEDVIDILVNKSVISINDLPQSVQLKLLTRKNLRQQGDLGAGQSELIEL